MRGLKKVTSSLKWIYSTRRMSHVTNVLGKQEILYNNPMKIRREEALFNVIESKRSFNSSGALETRKDGIEEFMTNEEILEYFEGNKNMNIDKLYTVVKNLSKKKMDEKKKIVEHEKFVSILDEIENRINIMNTRYLSNFALRLVSISITNEDIKKVLTKIGEQLMKKVNVSARDLVGVMYAQSLCNHVNEYFFEFVKKETIANIDAYTPTLLTQLLEGMRLSQNLDVELTNLIVEKMCEEIDRFTTKDVILALKTLSMAGIPRGFLIRRLCNLVFDNISHFHYSSLINILYNLTKLKFTNASHVDIIYMSIEEHLPSCNNATLTEWIYTLYINEITEEHKINSAFQLVQYDQFQTARTVTLIDFIHASTYYIKYIEKEKLLGVIDQLLKRNVPKSLTLIAKLREPLYFLASDSEIRYDIDQVPSSWMNAMNDFLRIDHEKLQALKTFHEIQNILQTTAQKFHLSFTPIQVVHSYSVDFLESSSKIVIDIDTIVRHTSFQIKHQYLQKLGYKTAKINFWRWRKCRTEGEQQNYLCDILYSLTNQNKNSDENAEQNSEKKISIGEKE